MRHQNTEGENFGAAGRWISGAGAAALVQSVHGAHGALERSLNGFATKH